MNENEHFMQVTHPDYYKAIFNHDADLNDHCFNPLGIKTFQILLQVHSSDAKAMKRVRF